MRVGLTEFLGSRNAGVELGRAQGGEHVQLPQHIVQQKVISFVIIQ
jgi:hypothetical protein